MKKFLVLALLLVYGATSFGFSINLHYCCGKLQEITLSNIEEHGCDKMPAKGLASFSKNCCIDQQFSISLHADQSQSKHEINISQASEILASNSLELPTVEHLEKGNYLPLLCNSPPGNRIPLFIKYCVFRV